MPRGPPQTRVLVVVVRHGDPRQRRNSGDVASGYNKCPIDHLAQLWSRSGIGDRHRRPRSAERKLTWPWPGGPSKVERSPGTGGWRWANGISTTRAARWDITTPVARKSL